MVLIYCTIFIIAGWIWGDWRNWRVYYPTILYHYIVNLLQDLLTYDYTLWKFQNNIPFLPNHIPCSLTIMFVNFTAIILIYLGKYPRRVLHQILWMLFWAAINVGIELISLRFHHIVYEHGWTLGWSIVIDILIYPLLRLHFKRPLLAWAATAAVFAFFIVYFHIPIRGLK
ncbi:MAG: CBO0543 family protein [Tumebacillaceae bacterium]